MPPPLIPSQMLLDNGRMFEPGKPLPLVPFDTMARELMHQAEQLEELDALYSKAGVVYRWARGQGVQGGGYSWMTYTF